MEITAEPFARIEPYLPHQRENVSHEKLNVINAILFTAENGCKWRDLPKRLGNWHTIYTLRGPLGQGGVTGQTVRAVATATTRAHQD